MFDRTRIAKLTRVLTFAALVLGAGAASAQTASTTFDVTATVVNKCTILAADLAFGTYDPTSSSAVTAENKLTVSCTKGATAWIGLSDGNNHASSSRRMSATIGATTEYLPYQLYLESAHNTVWGNTQATAKSYVSTSRAAQALTVYGLIPANADVSAGAFSDSVQATINF